MTEAHLTLFKLQIIALVVQCAIYIYIPSLYSGSIGRIHACKWKVINPAFEVRILLLSCVEILFRLLFPVDDAQFRIRKFESLIWVYSFLNEST